MSLTRLDITNFRNLLSAKLEPTSRGFNVIYGNNGSGKTSLLEAIYYLSLGRSFRSTTTGRIINHAADTFSIFAQAQAFGRQIALGIERFQSAELKIRIDGEDVQALTELVNLIPVQLINSHCYSLLDAGPAYRRKYLDWGSFYITPEFLAVWRNFERTLKQRNAALRQHLAKNELTIWNHKLVEQGLRLDQLRREYVENLLPLLNKTLPDVLNVADLDIQYQPGWAASESYDEVLRASLDRDMQLGYTQFGPHRADLKIAIKGTPAKDILSRGQQKLFVCGMILAQGALLYRHTEKRPIYLVDDLPSELDSTSRSNLIALLSRQEAQIFVTAVEREMLGDCFSQSPIKMFHVEHGEIRETA